MESMSLPALFEFARELHFKASESTLDQEMLRKGIQALRLCDDRVSKLGLFSSNETKDDVSTSNLKYLLIPYYLGELMDKVARDNRLEVLKMSQDQLKEFVSFCETLELVPEAELESSRHHGSAMLASQREKKMARFKRQRASEAKLLEIKERKERRARSLRAAALSSPVESGDDEILDDDDDGEEEREAWMTTISLALCKAFDLLEMLKKEEEMLLVVKEKLSEDGGGEFAREILDERTKTVESWHRNAASRAPYATPAQPITCATFAQDVIEGRAKASQAHEHKHQPLIFGPASLVGGRLTSERERMAAHVFQPGYRLPTMSIEEAGLREMEIMQKWQERNAELAQDSSLTFLKDTGGNDKYDDAAEKARAWDDWKDDHPRGSGNKKLTPCG